MLETVLSWEDAGRPWSARTTTPIPATLFGHPFNEHGVRDRLESAYRKLAQLAPTKEQRIRFVDQANDCRNRRTLRSAWRRIWS